MFKSLSFVNVFMQLL